MIKLSDLFFKNLFLKIYFLDNIIYYYYLKILKLFKI